MPYASACRREYKTLPLYAWAWRCSWTPVTPVHPGVMQPLKYSLELWQLVVPRAVSKRQLLTGSSGVATASDLSIPRRRGRGASESASRHAPSTVTATADAAARPGFSFEHTILQRQLSSRQRRAHLAAAAFMFAACSRASFSPAAYPFL